MPTREDALREKTHKGGTDTLEQRVFYTLHVADDSDLQTHRSTKAIALLISHLHKSGLISDDVIDDLLLESVGG
jgi:hypothetical protein